MNIQTAYEYLARGECVQRPDWGQEHLSYENAVVCMCTDLYIFKYTPTMIDVLADDWRIWKTPHLEETREGREKGRESKMQLSEQQLLKITIEMEDCITAREGMIAENLQRSHIDESMAYNDGDFMEISMELKKLREALK